MSKLKMLEHEADGPNPKVTDRTIDDVQRWEVFDRNAVLFVGDPRVLQVIVLSNLGCLTAYEIDSLRLTLFGMAPVLHGFFISAACSLCRTFCWFDRSKI